MLLSYLREKIKERFCSAKVEISHQNLPFPDYAYNRNRHQYYSTAILAQMKKLYKEKDEFILGIIYGLGHCRNPGCVMFFSNSILDTDRKSSFFCESCQIIPKSNWF